MYIKDNYKCNLIKANYSLLLNIIDSQMLWVGNPFSFSIRRGYWVEDLLTQNWNFQLEMIRWNDTEKNIEFLCNYVSHYYLKLN